MIVHQEMLEVTALLISKSNPTCILRNLQKFIYTITFFPISFSLALMALSISPREMGEFLPGSV